VKIGQVVQNLKGHGDGHTHTQHGDLKWLLPSLSTSVHIPTQLLQA